MTGVDPGYAQRGPNEGSEGICPGRGRGKTGGASCFPIAVFNSLCYNFLHPKKKGGLYGDEIRR